MAKVREDMVTGQQNPDTNKNVTFGEVLEDVVDSFANENSLNNNQTDNNYDAVEISEDTNAGFDILGILGGNVKSTKCITKLKDKKSEISNKTIDKIVDDMKNHENIDEANSVVPITKLGKYLSRFVGEDNVPQEKMDENALVVQSGPNKESAISVKDKPAGENMMKSISNKAVKG